jgi:hypothetical protein
MSCFILDATHYRVVRKSLVEHKYVDFDCVDEFIVRLLKDNIAAYMERYPKKHEITEQDQKNWTEELSTFGQDASMRSILVLGRPGLYKALQCIHYQCCDLTNFDDSRTGKQLDYIVRRIANDIISDLPEYESTPWGIDDPMIPHKATQG